jgi:hypothetical protein
LNDARDPERRGAFAVWFAWSFRHFAMIAISKMRQAQRASMKVEMIVASSGDEWCACPSNDATRNSQEVT